MGRASPARSRPTIFTDEMLAALVPYDTNRKMNRPLREAADRDATPQGLADGSIDVIATDHAPHHYDEKGGRVRSRTVWHHGRAKTAASLCSTGSCAHPRRAEVIEQPLSVNPAWNVPGAVEGAPADVDDLVPDFFR